MPVFHLPYGWFGKGIRIRETVIVRAYMIVREEMLPSESIRFFCLDRNYIFALLDGAMSPGRSFFVDYWHDMEMIDEALGQIYMEGALADVAMRNEPLRVVELAGTVRNIQKGLGLPEADSAVTAPENILEGFICP